MNNTILLNKETENINYFPKSFSPEISFVDFKEISKVLQCIQRPGRYTGGEFGIPKKNPLTSKVRCLLSYPDLYELGMSNEGLKILYDCINRNSDFLADRFFLPSNDFKLEIQKKNLPLYSLDHKLKISSFDVWGFNCSHEMHYTNLCYALDLAQIPILRKDRNESEPIIIAGGTAVSNPFPIFDFMDAIFLGDGEEAIIEVLEIIDEGKKNNLSRKEIIFNLQKVEGLVIPELYKIKNCGVDAYPKYIHTNNSNKDSINDFKIKKRNYKAKNYSDLENVIVPSIDIIQERIVVEVSRGCGQGCRFCHAGFWKRPVRNSEISELVKTAGKLIKKTGYNIISLHSLSIADYPFLEELVVEMAKTYGQDGISLSLPSLRVQVKTIPVLEMTSNIRKSNVTFALEAGSELQRERIRKKSSEENLHYLLKEIFSRGWDLVKVYFMLGLPLPENENNFNNSENIDENHFNNSEYKDLTEALIKLDRIAIEAGSKKYINITVSLYVPKPFTTFQWEKQQDPVYFHEALNLLKNKLKLKRVRLKGPSPEMPYIEGLLSRSDHRMGKWILKAYNNGAKFDSWEEHFSTKIWNEICDEIPKEQLKLWLDKKNTSTDLPWHEIIDSVNIELLRKDYKKFSEVTVENMNPPHPQALKESDFPPELLKPVFISKEKFLVKQVLKIQYSKFSPMIYISHLELVSVLQKVLRRANIPMSFTQGFNKKEKMHFFDTLPIYINSECESFFVDLYKEIDELELLNFKKEISVNMPKGLSLINLELIKSLPKDKEIINPTRAYKLQFIEKNLYSKIKELFKSIPSNPSNFLFQRIDRTESYESPKRKNNNKFETSRKLGEAINEIKFDEDNNLIFFKMQHPNTGAISIKDLLLYYLNLDISLWNVQVNIFRTIY